LLILIALSFVGLEGKELIFHVYWPTFITGGGKMKRQGLMICSLVFCLAVALLLSGCEVRSFCRKCPPKPKPVPACGSCVVLSKTAPPEVLAGQEFDYNITVTSVAKVPLKNVVVKDHLPPGYAFSSANPQPATTTPEKLEWGFDMLGPGESRSISVRGTAQNTGAITNCLTATYEIPTCLTINVVEPKLELMKTAPKEVLICDAIPVQLVVTNAGTSVLRDVKIEDPLPAGLATQDGSKSIVLNVGTLMAGESKMYDVRLQASETGTFVNKAVATAQGGISDDATTTTVVRQPVLAIEKTCKDKIFVGQNTTSRIAVSNKGDAAAANTILEDRVPANSTFVSASHGGQLTGGTVVWNLGTLMPDASKDVTLTLRGSAIGVIKNTAAAKATCAEPVMAECETKVLGIPAVLLEVIDIADPVAVGDNETYVITVTNQGSLSDTNIKIVVTLEDAMQAVSASGVTDGTIKDKMVTFAPLPSLAPKAKAVWKVVVKAVDGGDVRLKVTMTTDQLTRPVEETEATNFYK